MENKGSVLPLLLIVLFGGAAAYFFLRRQAGGAGGVITNSAPPCNVGFFGVNVPCTRLDDYRDKLVNIIEQTPEVIEEKTKEVADWAARKYNSAERATQDIATWTNPVEQTLGRVPVVGTAVSIAVNPVKTKNWVMDTAADLWPW